MPDNKAPEKKTNYWPWIGLTLLAGLAAGVAPALTLVVFVAMAIFLFYQNDQKKKRQQDQNDKTDDSK